MYIVYFHCLLFEVVVLEKMFKGSVVYNLITNIFFCAQGSRTKYFECLFLSFSIRLLSNIIVFFLVFKGRKTSEEDIKDF